MDAGGMPGPQAGLPSPVQRVWGGASTDPNAPLNPSNASTYLGDAPQPAIDPQMASLLKLLQAAADCNHYGWEHTMPLQRRLLGGIGGAARGVEGILHLLLADQLRGQGEKEQQAATLRNQMLTQFNTDSKALVDPAKVAELGRNGHSRPMRI